MEQYVNDLAAYARANPAIAGAVGLMLLYLLVRKTMLLLFLLLLAAALGGTFFVIGEISDTGGEKKHNVIKRIERQDVK